MKEKLLKKTWEGRRTVNEKELLWGRTAMKERELLRRKENYKERNMKEEALL